MGLKDTIIYAVMGTWLGNRTGDDFYFSTYQEVS
jgi:hypothetical protein